MVANSNYKYNRKHQVNNVECIEVSELYTRFILDIETKSEFGDRSILVVMKNPSQATKYQSDKTINMVISRLWKDYRHIYIANLFPYYSTKASGLLSFFERKDYQTVLHINQFYIKEYAKKANDFLIGWGTNTIGVKQSEYENVIDITMQLLLSHGKPIYYVHCCKCKNNVSGCGNSQICNNRCRKNCMRGPRGNSTCGNVRFPMHLELWSQNKSKIKY